MHGRIYIVLKESLRSIPVIGWGIQLSQFILLKRNWEKDKPNLSKHLQKLNKITDPMWLLLFPEGTNLAPSTREASKKWADKSGIKDMQHTLLPRTTGLQFCLQELRKTVGYVYDCTIAYEGVPRGQYAQDIYTLQAQYVQGNSPKCVHMYWRRFRVSDIPLNNEKSFDSWLRARWVEKDAYIEYFYRTGNFPSDVGTTLMRDGSRRKGAGYITTTIKATQWHEFLQVFIPIGILSLVLYTFYNQLPRQFLQAIKSGGERAVVDQTKAVTSQFGVAPKTITTYPGGPTITINSDKVDPQQAAQLLQRTTSLITRKAPAPKSRAPSVTSRRSSLVSQPTTASLASIRSNASSADWETMTNASIKSIPKLAPKALQKPLPNPAIAARKPALAAKPVVKKPAPAATKGTTNVTAPARQNQAIKKTAATSMNRTVPIAAKQQSKAPVKTPAKAPVKAATKPATKPIAKPTGKVPAKPATAANTTKPNAPKATQAPVKPTPKATPQKPAIGVKK